MWGKFNFYWCCCKKNVILLLAWTGEFVFLVYCVLRFGIKGTKPYVAKKVIFFPKILLLFFRFFLRVLTIVFQIFRFSLVKQTTCVTDMLVTPSLVIKSIAYSPYFWTNMDVLLKNFASLIGVSMTGMWKSDVTRNLHLQISITLAVDCRRFSRLF